MAFNTNGNHGDDEQPIIAEINMTPLIDIMLVLLIIFMVTSSVSLDSGLDIDLPKTKSAKSKSEDKSVIVSLDKDGGLYVQGKKIKDQSDLKNAIALSLQQESATLVIFQGDQNAKLGAAMAIMEIAKSAGAGKFAIAADENLPALK